jgi:hypothetical protein
VHIYILLGQCHTTRQQLLSCRALPVLSAEIYSHILPPNCCVLELCASAHSHLPAGLCPRLMVGQGMNSIEMEANLALHQHFLQVGSGDEGNRGGAGLGCQYQATQRCRIGGGGCKLHVDMSATTTVALSTKREPLFSRRERSHEGTPPPSGNLLPDRNLIELAGCLPNNDTKFRQWTRQET